MIILFKKGDVGDCSSYCFISLINVGSELFVYMLLGCLKDVGAETKIWETHFGFCSACGILEVLLLVRRVME